MTRQLFTDAGFRPELRPELRSPEAPRHLAAMARSASALLAELQASLEGSQRALLSHDLGGLERGTSEQIGLQRSLQALPALWSQNGAPRPDGAPGDATPLDPALAAGLRAAQWRVLYLGRVQAALLTRAQRSLRMLSNLLAGPEASYAAPSYAAPGYAAPAPASNRAEYWPGWMPARSASAPPGNEEGNQAGQPEDRNRNSDEEEADPCRV
jgi:hypothetical protein